MKISGFVVLISCFLAVTIGYTADSETVTHSISPVYEEMLGYQIKSMWRDLSKQHSELKHQEPRLVALDEQGEALIESVIKRSHNEIASALNELRPRNDGSAVIIILLTQSDPASLAKAAAYIGSRDAVQALLLTEEPVDSLISQIQNAGLAVVSVMSAFELEYVKGEDGRQIVQLDDPAYHQKIFERLVREGMNPVEAHPIVDQAVQDFRKLDRLKLVVLAREPTSTSF